MLTCKRISKNVLAILFILSFGFVSQLAAAVPTVTNVSPNIGPTSGGTVVTITGTGFTTPAAISVDFGATGASFIVNSDTSITATSPAHIAGAVNVRVANADGISPANPANVFTYTTLPTVLSVTPNQGPIEGGTVVTITGFNFTGAIDVDFGTTGASFIVNSDTSITATSPAHIAGAVNVRVTTSEGVSSINPASVFTYVVVSSPSDFIGVIQKDVFLNDTSYLLHATWVASTSTNVVLYRIFKGDALVAEISADAPLVFDTHLHSESEAESYQIAAVNSSDVQGEFVPITIVN